MTKYRKNYISKLITFFILITTITVNSAFANEGIKNSPKIVFWQSQKKGANIFNKNIESKDIKAAKAYGIEFIRLSPDKFLNPERIFSPKKMHIRTVYQEESQKMLYNLYSSIIKHIRLIDKETPIILDSSAYADPQTFSLLIPQKDENIFYSFHILERKYSYPAFSIIKRDLK